MCPQCVYCVLRGQLIPTFIWCNMFMHIYTINFLANSMNRIRNYLCVKTPERKAKHSRLGSELGMCERLFNNVVSTLETTTHKCSKDTERLFYTSLSDYSHTCNKQRAAHLYVLKRNPRRIQIHSPKTPPFGLLQWAAVRTQGWANNLVCLHYEQLSAWTGHVAHIRSRWPAMTSHFSVRHRCFLTWRHWPLTSFEIVTYKIPPVFFC